MLNMLTCYIDLNKLKLKLKAVRNDNAKIHLSLLMRRDCFYSKSQRRDNRLQKVLSYQGSLVDSKAVSPVLYLYLRI